MAVLSSRWRRLYHQSLLDFNACQPFPPEEGRGCEWVIRAITAILVARPHARIRSFRFLMYGQGFAGHLGQVNLWFRDLAHRGGVREVDVDMLYTVPTPPLPHSVLWLTSLQTLKVCGCSFPFGLGLTGLKTLVLTRVIMSPGSFDAMLSCCPSLGSAKLKNITGVDKIRVRSKTLRRLFGDFFSLNELVVEDAPSLEELVGVYMPRGKAKVKIVFAPKLQVLGCLGKNVHPLVLHDTMIHGGLFVLRTMMHSLRTLAIQVPFSQNICTTFVVRLLKCFPCLQML